MKYDETPEFLASYLEERANGIEANSKVGDPPEILRLVMLDDARRFRAAAKLIRVDAAKIAEEVAEECATNWSTTPSANAEVWRAYVRSAGKAIASRIRIADEESRPEKDFVP